MNPRDIESNLDIETLKLGSKESGDSVLVLMHVTYLAHLLCTYIQLTSTFLHAQASPPDYCSRLGSAPTATAHAQNVLHSRLSRKYVQKNLRLRAAMHYVIGNDVVYVYVIGWSAVVNSTSNAVRKE